MNKKLLVTLGGVVAFASLQSWLLQPANSAAQIVKQAYSKPQTVCIDPGHGGVDVGAVNGDLTEAAVNLQVALRVRTALEQQGYHVYMTRVGDRTMLNAGRYNYCNARKATILVSIHQNYYDDATVDYSTALKYKPQDVALADALANAVGKAMELPVTPPETFDGGVLISSHMPATIVEGMFITNNDDAYSLNKSTKLLDREASGIVQGINDYFAAHPKP